MNTQIKYIILTVVSLVIYSTSFADIIAYTDEANFLAQQISTLSVDFNGETTDFGPLYVDPGLDWAFVSNDLRRENGIGIGALIQQPPGAPISLYVADAVDAVGLRIYSNTVSLNDCQGGYINGQPSTVTITDLLGNQRSISASLTPFAPSFFGFSSTDGIKTVLISQDPAPGHGLTEIDHFYYTPGMGNLDITKINVPGSSNVPEPHVMLLLSFSLFCLFVFRKKIKA